MDRYHAHTAFIADLEKEIAWHAKGRVLMGYTLSRKERTWLLIIRAKHGPHKQVAFIEAPTPLDCWRICWVMLNHRGGLQWHRDKFA